jgi:hypothetical protein
MLDQSSIIYPEFGGKYSCEISVIICQTSRCQIPEDSNLRIHHLEKPEFHATFGRFTGAACFCLQAITSTFQIKLLSLLTVSEEPIAPIFKLA